MKVIFNFTHSPPAPRRRCFPSLLGVGALLAALLASAKELVVLRSHWLPGVGGRADGVATSGDVPAGHAFVANSCWDRNLSGVDGFYVLRDCSENNLDINCTVLKTAGQLSNCAPGLDEDLPSADPMDPTLEPGAPAQPTIPSAMPNGMSGN
jgi:hypothetical protein